MKTQMIFQGENHFSNCKEMYMILKILKVLLENYNYEVIDLGKDVPKEVILETALKTRLSL